MGTPYTEEEDKIIIEMNKAGFKQSDVAKVLKSREPRMIKARGYVLGLRWSKEPEIDYEAFKKVMKESRKVTTL